MKKIDLIGRIKRTIQTQIRHRAVHDMKSGNPMRFYANPEKYLRMVYASCYGRYPNFKHPQDMNQQLMVLSLEALRDPVQHQLRVQCADKYLVREYIKSKGLEDILIPSYGVFDSFDEIDFSKLPNQFVIQTNFGCGHIWICKDKKIADFDKWRKLFNDWMSIEHFGLETGEWQYAEIPHKLVITKYLDSLGAISVNDYKFQCFNGQIYGTLVAYDRDLDRTHSVQFDHYDINWNQTECMPMSWHPRRKDVAKPKCYEQMLGVAQKLSADFPYCRVDLYEANGNVYFGELTFTPQANLMNYYTNETLVDMLNFFNKTK